MSAPPKTSSRPRIVAFAIALGLLVMCAALWWKLGQLITGLANAPSWHESPGFFPALAMGLVAAGALGELWHHRRVVADGVGEDEIDATSSRIAPAMQSLGAFAAYAQLGPWLGYATSTLLFVTFMVLLHRLGAWAALLAGVLAAAILYAIFVLAFGVWFPEPAIWTWLQKAAAR